MKRSLIYLAILSCLFSIAYSSCNTNGSANYPCNSCDCGSYQTKEKDRTTTGSFPYDVNNLRWTSDVTCSSGYALCGTQYAKLSLGKFGDENRVIEGLKIKCCNLENWNDQQELTVYENKENSDVDVYGKDWLGNETKVKTGRPLMWTNWNDCPSGTYARDWDYERWVNRPVYLKPYNCQSKHEKYVCGSKVQTWLQQDQNNFSINFEDMHYSTEITELISINCENSCTGYQCVGCSGNNYLSGNSCQPCNFRCASCSDSNSCNSCAGSNREGSECLCKAKYFENNQYCQACALECATCSNANSCDTCIDPETREGPQCACKKGYYKDGDKCSQCFDGCSVCQSENVCSVCESELQSGPLCDVCTVGYFYDSEQRSCEACRNECGSCKNYESCETCRGNAQNRDAKTCECLEGYYEQGAHCLPENMCTQQVISNPKNPDDCQICNIYCQVCPSEGLCMTPVGQSLYDLSAVPNCAGCNVHCHACPEHFHESKSTCPKLVEESCGKAEITCLDCRDESMENRNPAGDCSCHDGFYDYKGQKCQACKESCQTCDTYSRCTSCPENSNKYIDETSGDCICKHDFYTDANENCQACPTRCDGCTDANTCKACVDPHRIVGPCDTCKDGYWMNKDVCQICSENCKTCSGRETCTSCPEGRELEAGECVCKLGTYPIDEVECGPCPEKCPSCTGPDSCEGYCAGNRKIENNCNCAENELDIEGEDCKPCNKKCTKCVDDVDTCDPDSPCSDPMRIYDENCRCPDGYTTGEDGSSCVKCGNEFCQKCDEDVDTCESCWSDDRHGTECKCHPGEFEIGIKECGDCNPKCETCSENADNCTTCKDPENRSIPSCECNEGLWDDNGVCKPRVVCTKIEIQSAKEVCNAFEITCNVCASEEQKCVPACSHGICTQSDLDILPACVEEQCTVGEPEKCDQDTKECVCDPGFYQVAEDRNDCWPCHYSCETCSAGEDTDCLTCADKSAPVAGKCPVEEIDVNDEEEEDGGVQNGQQEQPREELAMAQKTQHMRRN